MKLIFPLVAVMACLPLAMALAQESLEAGWTSLFDGESLKGWKSNEERPGVFSVVDGTIRANGGRAHLFYVGEGLGESFKDFELKLKVKTSLGSTSGIYFHTAFQERGWLEEGYECKINNSASDPRKTGSLYGIKDVMGRSPASDGFWADLHIKVSGKSITIAVNGQELIKYTEPPNVKRLASFRGRVLSEGTIALQGHDPESDVFFKDIQIKRL